MNKRERHRELIRLTAIARMVRMLGYPITYALAQDSPFWHEYWTRLAPTIGWDKRDEARLRAVANDIKPLLEGLTPDEQVAKVKGILSTGWDTADKHSRIHRMIARIQTCARPKTKPPDSP